MKYHCCFIVGRSVYKYLVSMVLEPDVIDPSLVNEIILALVLHKKIIFLLFLNSFTKLFLYLRVKIISLKNVVKKAEYGSLEPVINLFNTANFYFSYNLVQAKQFYKITTKVFLSFLVTIFLFQKKLSTCYKKLNLTQLNKVVGECLLYITINNFF